MKEQLEKIERTIKESVAILKTEQEDNEIILFLNELREGIKKQISLYEQLTGSQAALQQINRNLLSLSHALTTKINSNSNNKTILPHLQNINDLIDNLLSEFDKKATPEYYGFDEILTAQRKINENPEFKEFLKKLNQLISFQTPISCFVSYAYDKEKKTELFVKKFVADLNETGIVVLYDQGDNLSGNIQQFQNQILQTDFVILIGTEALMEKYNKGLSHINEEIQNINQSRMRNLRLQIENTCIPLLLQGSFDSSFPGNFVGHISCHAFGEGYYEIFKKLFKIFYQIEEQIFIDFKSLENPLPSYKKISQTISSQQIAKTKKQTQVLRDPSMSQPAYFIERDCFNQLFIHFEQFNPESQTKIISISGIAGSGKTQLALNLFQRFAAQFSFIAWFNADSQENLEQQFLAIANDIDATIPKKIPDHEKLARIKTALANHKDFLIIFDNATEEIDYSFFIPSMGGMIIFTTQHKNLFHLTNQINFELTKMNVTETCLLLSKISEKDISEQNADQQMLEFLDGLPLAISFFAGAILKKRTIDEIEMKGAITRSLTSSKSSREHQRTEKHLAIIETYNLIEEKLKTEQVDLTILYIIAHLNPDKISFELLNHLIKSDDLVDDLDFFVDINIIAKFKDELTQKTFYSIHRVFQLCIQQLLADRNEQVIHVKAILNYFSQNEIFINGKFYRSMTETQFEIMTESIVHLNFLLNLNLNQELVQNQLLLLHNAATFEIHKLGHHQSAINKILIIEKNSGYLSPLELSMVYYELHHAYRETNQDQPCIEACEKSIENYLKAKMNANIFTNYAAQSQHGIGRIYQKQAKYTEAIEAFQQSMSYFGDEINQTIQGAANLREIGRTYKLMGNYKLALENLNKAVDIFRQNLKNPNEERRAGNSDIASTLEIVAYCHYLQKDYKNALDMYQQELDFYQPGLASKELLCPILASIHFKIALTKHLLQLEDSGTSYDAALSQLNQVDQKQNTTLRSAIDFFRAVCLNYSPDFENEILHCQVLIDLKITQQQIKIFKPIAVKTKQSVIETQREATDTAANDPNHPKDIQVQNQFTN